ncbi:AAA family ATPase [Nocardia sp. NPDC049220]|uniref:AAA family ATPase n=1 Tax=Nocardia sp. NPDC049220 TaxID=3155273 RepID=UPI0033DFD481
MTDPSLAAISRALRMLLGDAELPLTASIDISGLGYANALYIATVLAEFETARESDLTLLLVEEPEAHLHQQLQTLLCFATSSGGPQRPGNGLWMIWLARPLAPGGVSDLLYRVAARVERMAPSTELAALTGIGQGW